MRMTSANGAAAPRARTHRPQWWRSAATEKELPSGPGRLWPDRRFPFVARGRRQMHIADEAPSDFVALRLAKRVAMIEAGRDHHDLSSTAASAMSSLLPIWKDDSMSGGSTT